MSISNEMAKYWADEDAEANDRPPQRELPDGKPFMAQTLDQLGAGYKAGALRPPSTEDLLRLEAEITEAEAEWAKGEALFDKIEALEVAWTELGYKIDSRVGGMSPMHLLLGGVIEALKELAYATKGAGR